MRRLTTLLLFAACLLTASRSSHAQPPVPNDVSPPLSFCIGSTATCVTPDFQLSLALYDLGTKKWSSGFKSAGAGYKLLFASDTPYASGIAAHATFNLSQATPNYVGLTLAAVLLRYFEAGVMLEFGDGYINKFLALGVNIPLDLLGGGTIAEKLKVARHQWRAANPGAAPAGGAE